MSPTHAFLILAGITIAALVIGTAIALWAARKGLPREIAEHQDSYWHRRT
jgi:hypothetical protein